MEDELAQGSKVRMARTQRIENIVFEKITPDKNNNWINLADNDWESFIPIADKVTKGSNNDSSIFKLFSLGNCYQS